MGAYSVICATILGITPPMPKPAIKRKILKLTGSSHKPAAAVKTLNKNTQIAIVQRRPIFSDKPPKKIAPNIMPNNAELAIKPAVEALTCISSMIDGIAAPATAIS